MAKKDVDAAAVTKKSKMPSILAFDKKLVPSEGYLYGTTWADRQVSAQPLVLHEKSVRGTISNRLKKALQDDPAKLDAEIEKANLQTIDSCALSIDQDTLKLVFTLKILSGLKIPSACNDTDFQATYAAAVTRYIEATGCKELATRYATNIANGRFFWRNRVGAEAIEVNVKSTEQSWVFADAGTISTRHFDNVTPEVAGLATKIADTLCGRRDFLLLDITAYAKIGRAQPVYPSEELILDKNNSKSKKSKVLFAVDGIAAMHTQKLGNALRAIDTWYPTYEEADTGPIAIEVYGAVTTLGKAFRTPKEKADFYTLFDLFSRGAALSETESHYVMAMLVRGGVFGESSQD